MAFVVEDGTGQKGATSYGTIAGFRAYFADRGVDVTAPVLSDVVIQGLLTVATDYIDTRWGERFKGVRRWPYLYARSVLTITALPSDGETVTIGSVIYTFRTTPTLDFEIEIGNTLYLTLGNLGAGMNLEDNEDYAGYSFADLDVAALTLYTYYDDIVSTETLADGSFDQVTTSGQSNKSQTTEFPRNNLYDSESGIVTGMPEKLKEATYEYAYRANSTTLAPDPVVHESGLRQIGDRVKVGPIETEVQFAGETSVEITRPYPAADRLLQEYVDSNVGVVRA